VPDTTCPGAVTPRVLLDGTGDVSRSWFVLTLGGHDVVHTNINQYVDSFDPNKTEEIFDDLHTAKRFSWTHDPGEGFLSDVADQPWGVLHPAGDQRIFFPGGQVKDGSWNPGKPHKIPDGYYVHETSLRDPTPKEWILWSFDDLIVWDKSSAAVRPFVSFEGRSYWRTVSTDQGNFIITSEYVYDENDKIHTKYYTTPFKEGATSSFFFESDEPWSFAHVLFRFENTWYLMTDRSPQDEPLYTLYRMTPEGAILEGSTPGYALLNAAIDVLDGRAEVVDGAVLGWSCEGGRCRVVRVRFSPFSIEEVGVVDTGAEAAGVLKMRALACGAVDLLLGTYTGTVNNWKPKHVLHARIAP